MIAPGRLTLTRRGALAALLATAASARAQPAAPLRVVASFSLLADMTQEVGGSSVEVTALVGRDADSHVFAPSPAHAQRLMQAQLVVVNGLGFEGWIDRLIRATGYRGPVVVASQGIAPRVVAGYADPHAWQSLVHAQRYVENIRAGIVQAQPAAAAAVNARAADYTRRMAALDASIRSRLAAVPAQDRVVVTTHAAFGYLADAYGLDFRAAQGLNSASEASAADVARLVRQLRSQRVRALFVENLSDPRLLARIAQEAGARLGGKLFSDALSAPGTPADTYLRLMAHNAESLLGVLKGE
jgi:zinc/manganese transport system substrate-binding protein